MAAALGYFTTATASHVSPAVRIGEVDVATARAVPTGIAELDRVLGGGFDRRRFDRRRFNGGSFHGGGFHGGGFLNDSHFGLGLVERAREVRFNEVSPHGLHGLEMGLAMLPRRMRAKVVVAGGDAGRDAPRPPRR